MVLWCSSGTSLGEGPRLRVLGHLGLPAPRRRAEVLRPNDQRGTVPDLGCQLLGGIAVYRRVGVNRFAELVELVDGAARVPGRRKLQSLQYAQEGEDAPSDAAARRAVEGEREDGRAACLGELCQVAPGGNR